MADLKISALTAASTPLAGTEVLPIVQSSTTVKVAVSDLTAGRAISATQLTLTTGNLIVASGQGIDFSATPGTGTSELLADYEEGTWTPTYVPDTGAFGAITYDSAGARYTKVGNVVHIQGFISTDAITVGSASGGVSIGNLPFTSVSNSSGKLDGYSALNISDATDFGVNFPFAAQVFAATTTAKLKYRTFAAGAVSTLQVTDLGVGTNANAIIFSGTYIAA